MEDNQNSTQYQNEITEPAVKKTSGRLYLIAILILLAFGCGVGGYFFGTGKYKNETASSGNDSQTVAAESSAAKENSMSDSSESTTYPWTVPTVVKEIDGMTYVAIAQKACPSVVEIDTETVTTGYWNQQYISAGAGSGVILSSDGYIITNNHVIEDTTTIIVRLTTGVEYEAKLIGLDEDLDIALLKIEAEGLTPAEIGSSANLLVGQEVVAIGNPMGNLGGTVTNGIVSAVNRKITMSNSNTMNLIQTNAAINPGNSGGGLFDAAGRLIGIVNAKMTDEDIEGLGFAIPIDDVLAILPDLYDYGYVKTGDISLGLTTIDINSVSLAWQYGVNTLGVYIYSVDSGSASSEAGLRSGDRIVSVNGESVSSSSDIDALLAGLSVGDSFTMEVVRRSSTLTVTVVCEEYIPAAIKAARY